MGAEDRTQNVINLLPVFPFSLGSKLTLITRHILPIVNQPAITGDGPAFGPIIMPPGRPPGDLDRATGMIHTARGQRTTAQVRRESVGDGKLELPSTRTRDYAVLCV